MSDTEPSARITMTAVYKEVQQLAMSVARLTESLPNHVDETRKRLNDHEARIRSVESRVMWAVGAFGIVAAASPFLARLIG